VATFTSRPLQPREMNARYILHRRLLGAQSSLDISLPGIEPRFLDCLTLSLLTLQTTLSRDSSVGVATRYGLGGPGSKSRWRRDFWRPSITALGPTSLLYNGYRVFPGGKTAEVKGRVELYLYSISRPSWPVIARTLLLTLLFISSESSLNSMCTTHLFEKPGN